jgi:hypothetical protein
MPPSQTKRASFPALRFPEEPDLDSRTKRGLMHSTASQPQAFPVCSSCHPWPCGRPSRPPRWGMTPTTTTVALSPSSFSRKEGDPMMRHDETTATRRPSTHPLRRLHWPVPTARKVASVMGQGAHRAGQRLQTSAAGSGIPPPGDWTSGSVALAIGRGSCGTSLVYRLRPCSAFPACSCPLQLSPPGQLDDPRTLLPVLPGCARDFLVRCMAHSHFPASNHWLSITSINSRCCPHMTLRFYA